MNPLPATPSEPTVTQSTWQTLKTRYRSWAIPAIISTVLYESFLVWLALTGVSVHEFFFVVPLVLAMALYAHVQRQMLDKMLTSFASQNGLIHNRQGNVDQTRSSLFGLPGSSAVLDVITGIYKGYTSTAFLSQRTVQEGKNSVTYSYTTVELDLQSPVPSLLIIPNGPLGVDMIDLHIPDAEDVSLEGDFNKTFDVSARKGMQIPVRQILTPDVMAMLQDHANNYAIEFAGTKVYLYRVNFVNSATELKAMYDLLVAFAGKLNTELKGFQADDHIVAAALTHTFKRNAFLSSSNAFFIIIVLCTITIGFVLLAKYLQSTNAI
jgi:hypothetical protein